MASGLVSAGCRIAYSVFRIPFSVLKYVDGWVGWQGNGMASHGTDSSLSDQLRQVIDSDRTITLGRRISSAWMMMNNIVGMTIV